MSRSTQRSTSRFAGLFLLLGAAALAGCSDSTRPEDTPVTEMIFGAIADEAVVMGKADGSWSEVLVPATPGYFRYTTDWDPAGRLLVYEENGGYGPGFGEIKTVDVVGNVKSIGNELQFPLYPEFSPDGAWIYFARNLGYPVLSRERTDGSKGETLAIEPEPYGDSPSLSPDGKRMVFVTYFPRQLAILDIATGVWSYLDDAIGESPAWSPDGRSIAYVDIGSNGGLRVVEPDGSNDRRVGDQMSHYDIGIDWSPDGKWIIARNATRDYLELIDPASDVTHPILNTAGFHGPSWRP